MLIAQNDEPEMLEWLNNASQKAGCFLSNLAQAGLRADEENYPMMRPLLFLMRMKYPEYEATEAVQREIRERSQS